MFRNRDVTRNKKKLNPTFGFSRTATWWENFQYESTNIDSLEKSILTFTNLNFSKFSWKKSYWNPDLKALCDGLLCGIVFNYGNLEGVLPAMASHSLNIKQNKVRCSSDNETFSSFCTCMYIFTRILLFEEAAQETIFNSRTYTKIIIKYMISKITCLLDNVTSKRSTSLSVQLI